MAPEIMETKVDSIEAVKRMVSIDLWNEPEQFWRFKHDETANTARCSENDQ